MKFNSLLLMYTFNTKCKNYTNTKTENVFLKKVFLNSFLYIASGFSYSAWKLYLLLCFTLYTQTCIWHRRVSTYLGNNKKKQWYIFSGLHATEQHFNQYTHTFLWFVRWGCWKLWWICIYKCTKIILHKLFYELKTQ